MSAEATPQALPPVKGGVAPYLMVDGASAAAEFYKTALAAELVGRAPPDDKGREMHIHLYVNGGSVMLCDPMPEHGYPLVPPAAFNLHIQSDDCRVWFDRAVGAGCTVIVPVTRMFWGDDYGMVKDPYGVTWAFGSTPK